jgi:NAD(P)-dependent dehydrogenase (short-subunit alcohol dehydrogenase family)
MHGKTVIVTGAGSGIGLETADALARKGASLVLVELEPARGDAAVARIAKSGSKPRLFVADLSRQTDVRRVAGEILASTPRIDVLINNAGAMFTTRQVTADGLERTFALNHLGYFLLTNLLLDRIIPSTPARIISVSSAAHRRATLDFDDLQVEKKYSGQDAYDRSKLANILFTRALSRRLQGTGVTANCLEPAPGIVRSHFFENVGGWVRVIVSILQPIASVTPAEGAKTSIYLASSAEVEGISGQYFAKCRVAKAAAAAEDDFAAEQLWVESLRLSGLQAG